MTRGFARMENLEVLLCIKVSDSAKGLIGLGDKPKQLKKLGAVLYGKKANLKDLFIQIDKSHRILRTLSIRMEQLDKIDGVLFETSKAFREPKHLWHLRKAASPYQRALSRCQYNSQSSRHMSQCLMVADS
jgi:hypothetical protein